MFLLDSAGCTRAQAAGCDWVEDVQYSRLLDADWDLAAVREVTSLSLHTRLCRMLSSNKSNMSPVSTRMQELRPQKLGLRLGGGRSVQPPAGC